MAQSLTPPPDILRVLSAVAGSAVRKAKARSLPCDPALLKLALEFYAAQGGLCAVTGLPFDLRTFRTGKARRPFAPSIDRIDTTGGYVRDNIRLVCQSANFAMNAFGEDVFYNIAAAAVEFERKRPSTLAADKVKAAYIDYVVRQAPFFLREAGGLVDKVELRRRLRQHHVGPKPVDEGNAYGWAFRKLTERGVIEPTSGKPYYVLRRCG